MRSASEILDGLLASDDDSASLLHRLCEQCVDTLPVTGAGLALMNDSGHQGVLVATDRPAAVMEDLQFTLGEGPCLDASLARRPVLQPDLSKTAAARWPGFGPEALDAGICAIFAFPLQLGAIRLGILDLYCDSPGNLEPDAFGEALAFAEAAVSVLLHLQGEASADDLPAALAGPLENQFEIHQATGIVSVSARVTLAEALALLRAHAYSNRKPVLDIARDVIAGTVRIQTHRSDDE